MARLKKKIQRFKYLKNALNAKVAQNNSNTPPHTQIKMLLMLRWSGIQNKQTNEEKRWGGQAFRTKQTNALKAEVVGALETITKERTSMRWLGLRRKQFKDPTKKENILNALNAEVAQNNSKTPPQKKLLLLNEKCGGQV